MRLPAISYANGCRTSPSAFALMWIASAPASAARRVACARGGGFDARVLSGGFGGCDDGVCFCVGLGLEGRVCGGQFS
jgi:hypothetical protein